MKHHIPITLSKESDVSLINGSIRNFNSNLNKDDENNELVKRNDNNKLSILHESGAGEFLKNRSWSGLEQKIGETPVTKVTEGLKGLAASYASEPSK